MFLLSDQDHRDLQGQYALHQVESARRPPGYPPVDLDTGYLGDGAGWSHWDLRQVVDCYGAAEKPTPVAITVIKPGTHRLVWPRVPTQQNHTVRWMVRATVLMVWLIAVVACVGLVNMFSSGWTLIMSVMAVGGLPCATRSLLPVGPTSNTVTITPRDDNWDAVVQVTAGVDRLRRAGAIDPTLSHQLRWEASNNPSRAQEIAAEVHLTLDEEESVARAREAITSAVMAPLKEPADEPADSSFDDTMTLDRLEIIRDELRTDRAALAGGLEALGRLDGHPSRPTSRAGAES